MPSTLFPSFVEVLTSLRDPAIWQDAAASMTVLIAALVRAATIGLPLGALVGCSPVGTAVFYPALRMLRMLPIVALVPLFILWLGLKPDAAYWPVLIAMMLVVASDTARSVIRVNAATDPVNSESGLAARLKLALVHASPGVFDSLRRAVEIGATVLIASQCIAGNSDIGSKLMLATLSFETAKAMAIVLVIGGLVICLECILYAVEGGVNLYLHRNRL
jgi:ABC-type nitrate/sulfonate/bicarbonate transport system permease component